MNATAVSRAVIFDLDGTLVDSAPDLMAATNRILTRHGRRPVALEEVRRFVGHGARALITRGFAATGEALADGALEPLYQEFVASYADNIAEGSRAFPGVEALLERCRMEGVALGVCTNKLEGLSVKLLAELGLGHYFGAVVGPDTLGIAKPDPRPLLETAARLGLAKGGRAIMIGDSETDILTARAAGMPVIAVPFGYTPRPVSEFAPDALVEHYDGMWDAIARLLEP